MRVGRIRDFSRKLMLGVFIVLLFLAGCSSAVEITPLSTETSPAAQPSDTPQAMPTQTAATPPGRVVLVSSELQGIDTASFSEQVASLAAQSGLIFDERTSFDLNEIGEDWQIVVLTRSEPVLSEALTAFPEVQFVVLSEQELTMAPNLSVIRLRWDYQAFMAGYLSILITYDWRTGGIFPPGDSGALQAEAFVNGGQYFCGICASKLSPIIRFPVTTSISGDADAGVWQAEVDALLGNILYGLYVAPGSSSTEMLNNLAQRGLVLVGGETPAAELRPRWAATVSIDPSSAFAEIWQGVVAGRGGTILEASIRIKDINEEYFSVGRQRLVEETLQELEAGWINPLDVPVE